MHRVWGSLFWLFTIAVKQHFLTFCCHPREEEAANHGQKMNFGAKENQRASERARRKNWFSVAVQMCNLQKSTGHWPYHENTFIVSCFASNTTNIPVFKYFFPFCCAVSRLFRLGCFAFLILHDFLYFIFRVCGDMQRDSHTLAALCIWNAEANDENDISVIATKGRRWHETAFCTLGDLQIEKFFTLFHGNFFAGSRLKSGQTEAAILVNFSAQWSTFVWVPPIFAAASFSQPQRNNSIRKI